MIRALVVALAFAVVYWFPIRRWMGHWGTTSSDLTRGMAGDGLVVDPTFSYTTAITINARPEHIWPWLTVLLMLLAISFAAAAFGTQFRAYSIATLAVLAGFGALTFLDAPRIAANLPTPWIGVWERINITVFLLWVVVLAVTLLRIGDTAAISRQDHLAA
jgi:hypothetical protein